MNKIIAYKNTLNLGDAIQSFAMCKFLELNNIKIDIHNDISYRQNLFLDYYFNKDMLFVNGWHRKNEEPLPKKGFFVSLHSDINHLKRIDKKSFVGCRDSFTLDNSHKVKLQAIMTGCVTITLEPKQNEQKTENILFIDSIHKNTDPTKTFTQRISKDLNWEDQLILAQERLNILSTAALVHTKRLHILLPCIAMGVPVVLDTTKVHHPERLSFFLDFIPVNEPIENNSGIKEALLEVWNNGSAKIIERYLNDL